MHRIILPVIIAAIVLAGLLVPGLIIQKLPVSRLLYSDYVDTAVRLNKPWLCSLYPFGTLSLIDGYSTPASSARRYCFADFAIRTDNVSYCLDLGGKPVGKEMENARNYCITELSVKLRRPELCLGMRISSSPARQNGLIENCIGVSR